MSNGNDRGTVMAPKAFELDSFGGRQFINTMLEELISPVNK
jgi:hypothetical protein